MPISRSRPILVPLVVACAMFMQNLDSTVIATALPTIACALDESPLRRNVAFTCYLLSLAVFIPISGWTAGRTARAAADSGKIRSRERDVVCQRPGTDRAGDGAAARRLHC